MDRRDEKRQALLLPARKLAETPGPFVPEMDLAQAVEDRGLGERHSVETCVQLDDLADLELRLEARRLQLHADQGLGQPGVGPDVDLADQDRAGGRLEQSLARAAGACAARSIPTQKAEDLAFVDLERDPIHRPLGAVVDAQVIDLESKTSHRRRIRGQYVYSQGIQRHGAEGCGSSRDRASEQGEIPAKVAAPIPVQAAAVDSLLARQAEFVNR